MARTMDDSGVKYDPNIAQITNRQDLVSYLKTNPIYNLVNNAATAIGDKSREMANLAGQTGTQYGFYDPNYISPEQKAANDRAAADKAALDAAVKAATDKSVADVATKDKSNEVGTVDPNVGKQTITYPSYAPVKPTDYTAQFEALRKAKIQGLKNSAQQQKNALAERKAGIDPRYAASKTQADVNGQIKGSRLAQIMAGRGYGTGNQAQDMLIENAQTQGEVSSLEAQRQAEQDQIARDSQNIDTTLAGDIAAAESGIDADKLKALIDEQNRVDNLNYNRGQDSFNNNLNLAGITGRLSDGTLTMQGKQLSNQESQDYINNAWNKVNQLGYVDDSTSKILGIPTGTKTQDAKKQEIDNAWNIVNSTGKVDANTSKILNIPEGTSTLDAQKFKLDKDLAEAGVTGNYVDGNGNTIRTLNGKEFDWNTDLEKNPQLAQASQQLKQDKATFEEWVKQAPQRLALINNQVSQAKSATELAIAQTMVEKEKAAQEKINTSYADRNAKASLAKSNADLKNIESDISYRAGQLGVDRGQLKLEQDKFKYEKANPKPSSYDYKTDKGFQSDYVSAQTNSAKVYSNLKTMEGAKAVVSAYGIDGYKALLSASAPKSVNPFNDPIILKALQELGGDN